MSGEPLVIVIPLVAGAALVAGLVLLALRRRGDQPDPVPAAPDLATGCDPSPKPAALAFRVEVLERFGGRDLGIVRACDVGGPSEHQEGRAWDWAAPAGAVDACFNWLEAGGGEGFRRWSVMYVLHAGRIWRGYGAKPGWSAYDDDRHDDHVHFSFWRET